MPYPSFDPFLNFKRNFLLNGDIRCRLLESNIPPGIKYIGFYNTWSNGDRHSISHVLFHSFISTVIRSFSVQRLVWSTFTCLLTTQKKCTSLSVLNCSCEVKGIGVLSAVASMFGSDTMFEWVVTSIKILLYTHTSEDYIPPSPRGRL